jgi:hypothetical protein
LHTGEHRTRNSKYLFASVSVFAQELK